MKAQGIVSAHGIGCRIFVVGVPRSGTTLVQSLLAAHSRMTSFTESHFFSRHYRTSNRGSPRSWLLHDPAPRFEAFLAENGIDLAGDDGSGMLAALARDASPAWLRPFRGRRVARRFLTILDRLALGRGADGWIEKTPMHLHFVPFLERVSTDVPTYFVHVIRDGLETVASLHEASKRWPRSYDLDTCVARWNADLARSRDRIGSPNDRFVIYERLTERPEPVLRSLVTNLGLDWEPEILDRFAETSSPLITRGETWKAGMPSSIRPRSTSARVLTAEQRDRARQLLDNSLYDDLNAMPRADR